MRNSIIIFFLAISSFSSANDTTANYLKINFLYGSKPAKGFKQTESKHFGGLKGGHVNIEAGGRVLDFLPGKNPILPVRKKPSGGYRLNNTAYKNKDKDKWVTIVVPFTQNQFIRLQAVFDSLATNTPYDYAIFGMRCAAASYDVLSEVGLFKKLSNKKNIAKHFYPKLLRNEGRCSRKWESDKGIL
jgi:hypothetical protein